MKILFFYFKYYISCILVNFFVLFKNKKNNSRVLMFHGISENIHGDILGIYNLDKNRFQKQITYLLRQNIEFISIGDLINNNKKGIAISFDDGYANLFNLAYPFLKKNKIPFSIFICPSLIESRKNNFLNHNMIINLSKDPLVTIGSHSYNHFDLTQLTADGVHKELFKSKKWLEMMINKKIQYFSYPHGKYNSKIIEAVEKAGYKAAFTSKFGSFENSKSNFEINRTDIWSLDTHRQFINKCFGFWDSLMKNNNNF